MSGVERPASAQEALAPDYYPRFRCKGPACRHPCCSGWGISITFNEYCRLLGMPCSKGLRKLLDRAFTIAEHPAPERYALVSQRLDGDCPLHREDGWCALHAEKGESALPSSCRLYPRVIRGGARPECACANSCEAVLELMAGSEAPLSFVTVAKPAEQGLDSRDLTDAEQALRWRCLDVMRDRALPLRERLARLGALTGCDHGGAGAGPEPSAVRALLLSCLPEGHARISGYREKAMDALGFRPEGQACPSPDPYARAIAGFEAAFPRWEIFFEHLLANHMFRRRFPYPDGQAGIPGAYAALCAAYALLRVLCAGCLQDGVTFELVDLAAALFRTAEHSGLANRVDAELLAEGVTGPGLSVLTAM